MRRTLVLSAFLLTLVGMTTAAYAHVVRYVSKHPIPKKVGHGFCYITVPHFHDYEPSDPRLYRQMDGQYYFVGDPAPFDYDGPRYSYYGAHPIADAGSTSARRRIATCAGRTTTGTRRRRRCSSR